MVATIILLFAMIWHCENEFANRFYISIVFGLLSGILHLMNGLMCLYYMPGEEAYVLITDTKISQISITFSFSFFFCFPALFSGTT